jgi:hypothetical protein
MVGEVDEETAADRVVGRERQAEHSLLATEGDAARQVQEIGGENHPRVDETDASGLLDDYLDGASVGPCMNATGKEKPDACTFGRSCDRTSTGCTRGTPRSRSHEPITFILGATDAR